MSTFARRRIIQDISRILRDPPKGTQAQPFPDNIMYCHAIINGPEGTIWECGEFHLLIKFSEEYPTKPPTVQFLSKIFHPNGWCGITNLQLIQVLLNDPNPSSPANSEAAELYTDNRHLYEYKVLKSVEDSWLVPSLKDLSIT